MMALGLDFFSWCLFSYPWEFCTMLGGRRNLATLFSKSRRKEYKLACRYIVFVGLSIFDCKNSHYGWKEIHEYGLDPWLLKLEWPVVLVLAPNALRSRKYLSLETQEQFGTLTLKLKQKLCHNPLGGFGLQGRHSQWDYLKHNVLFVSKRSVLVSLLEIKENLSIHASGKVRLRVVMMVSVAQVQGILI